MKNKKIFLAMLAIALVLGMTVVGCKEDATKTNNNNNNNTDNSNNNNDNNSSGNNSAKTLVITNVPANLIDGSVVYDASVGIYAQGTTVNLSNYSRGLVAGLDSLYDYAEINGSTITIPLYTLEDAPWKGSGTYDVYLVTWDEDWEPVKGYKKTGVSFNSATTTIDYRTATVINP